MVSTDVIAWTSGIRHRHYQVPTKFQYRFQTGSRRVSFAGDTSALSFIMHFLPATVQCIMPMCGMFGRRTRSKSSAQSTNSEPGIGQHCLPKEMTWKCERTKQFSEKRRSLWLTRIDRKDLENLNNVRVCSHHFIKGKEQASPLNGD